MLKEYETNGSHQMNHDVENLCHIDDRLPLKPKWRFDIPSHTPVLDATVTQASHLLSIQ